MISGKIFGRRGKESEGQISGKFWTNFREISGGKIWAGQISGPGRFRRVGFRGGGKIFGVGGKISAGQISPNFGQTFGKKI